LNTGFPIPRVTGLALINPQVSFVMVSAIKTCFWNMKSQA
jgi:hypothetical protein